MPDEPVLMECQGAVATLTLNRPEKLNALDETMRAALHAALEAVAHEAAIRVAVITGAGRAFCSGGDVEAMQELKTQFHSVTFRSFMELGHELVQKLRSLSKPVVASVNGPAMGAGMNLALACDLRIASDHASFAQAFARLGLHPDWGGTYFLPRLVGVGRAMEMFFLGDPVNAAEAHRLGLVNFLAQEEDLAAETRRLAERLAEAPPLPLALLKQSLYEREETELSLVMRHEVEAQMKCFESEDFTEGLRAFMEKRKPTFKGK
jgi:2-(1,2-epoxy-1,2-dihydrophenyl)acetyl-CoA isomerase